MTMETVELIALLSRKINLNSSKCQQLIVCGGDNMWPYNIVSREQFEEKKDYIQSLIVKLGGKIADIYFPYQQQTTSRFNNYTETYPFNRPVFFFNNLYYRVDEVLFRKNLLSF